jgi:leader peptidase (prepilin peptidase)/N-methyltransferase
MDTIIFALQKNPTLLLASIFIFGLMVGSFLNVVIHRLPKMLFAEWRHMAIEVLNDQGIKIIEDNLKNLDNNKVNLITPRSRCPHCGHAISAAENIPVISYLLQKGRCKGCSQPISPRYPLVEILTAITMAVCAHQYGLSWQLAVALVFTAYLIAMSFIDADHQILPDNMTLPLLWLGLIVATQSLFIPLEEAVIGAAVGYLSLWSVYWLFKLLTGKEGMGHGDFKLLAALGAFVGWQKVLLIIVLSALIGAIIGGTIMAIRKSDSKIPFGPYLAIAGWITLLWGDQLLNAYFTYAGI